jgi:hypothetical protein
MFNSAACLHPSARFSSTAPTTGSMQAGILGRMLVAPLLHARTAAANSSPHLMNDDCRLMITLKLGGTLYTDV